MNYDKPLLSKIKKDLLKSEDKGLSIYAAKSKAGVRRNSELRLTDDYRTPFSADTDRILHSLAFTRYIDKTQVFSLIRNDHLTHRVLHVQLVSKIARTIGKYLKLNQDLIEAIALGHDIGHPPFGHDGERILSEICKKHGIGKFEHNAQSVQFLDRVEQDGKGWNLCLQTLDGILCHDGEIHNQKLIPDRNKCFHTLDRDFKETVNSDKELVPMTLEGCVVRMSDTIGYIGRDIEDAIRLKLIKRSDLPENCTKILGNTNGTIVHTLVTDVIQNSIDNDYTAFSPEVSDALKNLKDYNMENIYLNPDIKNHLVNVKSLYELLFEKYMENLEKKDESSVIYTKFLSGMKESQYTNQSNAEMVRDFIAGMTDRYFLQQCPDSMRPDYLNI